MGFIQTDFDDLLVFEPSVFEDDRGYFMETFNAALWKEQNMDINWVQDNESKSSYGVIRGLHFQKGEMAQAKLVRVIKGKVLDVVLDIRKESKTFGKTFSILLTGKNKKQLFVPRGFAHGYAVLQDETIFAYKCDNNYSKKDEGSISYGDPSLGIDWLIEEKDRIISEKDSEAPLFKNLK